MIPGTDAVLCALKLITFLEPSLE